MNNTVVTPGIDFDEVLKRFNLNPNEIYTALVIF